MIAVEECENGPEDAPARELTREAVRRGGREVPPLRLSLVTLGVADLVRAAAFYEKLGLARKVREAGGVVFLEAGPVVLALYPRHELATDAGVVDGRHGQFGGVALACNRASRADVDATLIRAVAAGGRALRPAQATFWGGYSGYVADPDGYPWEIAHNPGFGLDEEGRLILPA
ncbi:VOC family protein [Ancylobacter sp. MQZ15Z-1]|uniref:VOC family protein n=1 Tax=Ancylobacter mangrovi TaxID=2972472 RepID=A0A9X2T209_9HYPH|nr:VOC family protein [Ancylobacter mangrovi]MCS0495367.1 VOC family protein [Ancylobacter mangrovi]